MKNRWLRSLMFLLPAAIGFAPSLHADEFHYAGTIATADQYDLYPLNLAAGTHVVVDLICAPDPNNTLDTVLSVFAPGVDPSDVANATYYNDDGGTEVCGGFRSSRLEFFVATDGGDWTFRVDGFGSATGDYTLDIVTTTSIVAIPALDTLGLGLLFLLLGGAAMFLLRRQRHA